MSVTGYLALYTTLLGWQQYQNLWNIAVGTGLVYLPFVGIVLSTTIVPFTSMGAKDAAQISLRRLTIQVLTALFIIVFAAQPMVTLDPTVLHYQPACENNLSPATPGHTGTTYDNAFPVPTGVKVPLWWYLVMAFANGVTTAATDGLPCAPLDYRALHTELNTASIQDPTLKQEVNDFYQDCYVPSYGAYLSNTLSPDQQAQVQQSLSKNGNTDVEWLGSQTFLNVAGLYGTHNATHPVNRFAFDPNRDQIEGQVDNHSPWGMPDCKTWWSDPTNGLESQLKQTLPPTFWQQLSNAGGDATQLQSVVIKTLINNNSLDNQRFSDKLRGYESLNDNTSGDYLSRFLGAPMGIAYESMSFFPKLHLLINALPVIQGTLLFGVYAFLALGIPFSSYRISFFIMASVVLFSLIFCSFIWQLTAWFDSELIQALYPPMGNVPGLGILDINSNVNPNAILVTMIVGTLYVVLPLLWMTVMSWCGYHAGVQVMGFVNNMAAPAHAAGEKAGSRVGRYLP